MPEDPTGLLLERARQGDRRCRNDLIERHRPFIAALAARICRRPLRWGMDEELSIALMAFDQAIDNFNPEYGSNFLTHAGNLIRRRLIDHFRREGRHRHLSLNQMLDESAAGSRPPPAEMTRLAAEEWARQDEAAARAEESVRLDQLLRPYGLSLADLFRQCPSHRDTRARLTEVARRLVNAPGLVQHLRRHRRLPARELAAMTGVSARVLERGRPYIVALAVLMIEPEFHYLRSFAGLPPAKGGNGDGAGAGSGHADSESAGPASD